MTVGVGIALAFVAMLCWGFGDFMIQRSTRKIGNWETLFIITLFGFVVLLPFVWGRLESLFTEHPGSLTLLLVTSVVLFLAALLDFEALRRGKLSVIEPIWSLEVPAAAVLAFFLIHEQLSALQIVLLVLLVLFLVLVAFKRKHFDKRILFEKGVIVAIAGAIFMGAANFFMGWSGRVTDPIITNFFTDAFIMVMSGVYLLVQGKFRQTFRNLRVHYDLLLPMSIADKVAWIAFVFAMSLAPIAIATALSESYIIFAVILGLLVNRERIHTHQKVGLVGAIAVAITLAVITSSS